MLNDSLLLADLLGLSPASYVMRLFLAVAAFAGAINVEKTLTRSLGFVFLLLLGVGLLLTGVSKGTIGDIVLGVGLIVAAFYSWWFTRH